MAQIILEIPEELKKKMDRYPHIDWNAVAVEAIRRKLHALEKENPGPLDYEEIKRSRKDRDLSHLFDDPGF